MTKTIQITFKDVMSQKDSINTVESLTFLYRDKIVLTETSYKRATNTFVYKIEVKTDFIETLQTLIERHVKEGDLEIL